MSFRRAASSLAWRAARSFLEPVKHASPLIPAATQAIIRSEPTLFRTITTSFAARTSLSDVLKTELEYENQNYTQPEELSGGPPAPFTLTESKGDTLLALTATHGSENIEITVMVNDQPEEEPFEDEDGVLDVDVGVLFNVAITKGNDSLVFECKSDGSYLDILHAGLEPADGEMEDSAYTGPVFDELDEALQQQLREYLNERGVNADVGGYLLRLVHDKEQREYMYWLEKMQSFVQK